MQPVFKNRGLVEFQCLCCFHCNMSSYGDRANDKEITDLRGPTVQCSANHRGEMLAAVWRSEWGLLRGGQT